MKLTELYSISWSMLSKQSRKRAAKFIARDMHDEIEINAAIHLQTVGEAISSFNEGMNLC